MKAPKRRWYYCVRNQMVLRMACALAISCLGAVGLSSQSLAQSADSLFRLKHLAEIDFFAQVQNPDKWTLSKARLLYRPSVLEALKLDDAQSQMLEALVKDVETEGLVIFVKFTRKNQEVDLDSDQAWELRDTTLLRELEQLDRLVPVILNDKQNARLKQIWLQSLGTAAFRQKEVIEQLSLTPEQCALFEEVRADRSVIKIGESYFHVVESTSDTNSVQSTLTDPQLEKWKQMIGATVPDVQPDTTSTRPGHRHGSNFLRD